MTKHTYSFLSRYCLYIFHIAFLLALSDLCWESLFVKFLQPYFYFLTFIFFSLKFISFSSNLFSSSNSCLLPFALIKFHLVLNFLFVTIGSVKIKMFHVSAYKHKSSSLLICHNWICQD